MDCLHVLFLYTGRGKAYLARSTPILFFLVMNTHMVLQSKSSLTIIWAVWPSAGVHMKPLDMLSPIPNSTKHHVAIFTLVILSIFMNNPNVQN